MLNVVLLVIVLATSMAGVSALHRIGRRAPDPERSAPRG